MSLLAQAQPWACHGHRISTYVCYIAAYLAPSSKMPVSQRDIAPARLCLRSARLCLPSARLCLLVLCLAALAMALAMADALLGSSLAHRSVLNVFGDAPTEEMVHLARDTESHLLATPTPHGSVLKEVRVPKNDGSEHTMLFCRPKALLWLAVRLSTAFEIFLRKALPAGASRVTLYMDDVRPGNQLRPDMGRTYYAWYWTILDLPAWFRTSEHGWFDLAYTPIRDCQNIHGDLSGLTDQILAEMEFPMHIDLPVIGPPLPLALNFSQFMSDAKALQQMLGCKNSSSYKPCLCCRNIVG